MPDYNDLIGKPYSLNGHGPEYYGCYGLAVEVYRRNGITLRDVIVDDNHDLELSNRLVPTLNVMKIQSIEKLALLEICLFNELHVGVVLDRKNFIHATRNKGVVVSPIGAYKINGIYRVI